jgi:predicted nucleic acid-binding protein
VVYPDERFVPVYGEVMIKLQRTGRAISTMDLLIATAAVVDDASLVTANRKHLENTPGLEVLSY